MGLDALAKRYSSLAVCLMIAIAAYFQASGLGKLVGAMIAPASMVGPARGGGPHPFIAVGNDRDLSATSILERNPFDSITGPITDPVLILPGEKKEAPSPSADPYRDPPCEMAKVVLIASSSDPAWSFAAITGPDGKTVLRRSGDDFYGGKVGFVGDQRPTPHLEGEARGLWDRVWLTSPNGTRCQLALGAVPKGAPPAPAAPAAPARGGAAPDLRGGLRKIGDHEYEVQRSVVDALLANPAELMKTRVVPDKQGDRVVGIKLYGIRPDSLLSSIGLENGDSLSSINGFEMNDPQKMLEAYSKLLRADHLTTNVVRNGKPMTLEFSIK
jgi:general secretion pathway protein C